MYTCTLNIMKCFVILRKAHFVYLNILSFNLPTAIYTKYCHTEIANFQAAVTSCCVPYYSKWEFFFFKKNVINNKSILCM